MEQKELVYTEEQARAKEIFCKRRGEYKWKSSSLWDDILLYDHKLISGYADYSSLPFERGALSPVMCELVAIVIDSSITHLHQAGLRNHIGHALEVGATEGEVLEAVAIASTLGSRTYFEGYAVLAEELEARGLLEKNEELTDAQRAVKETFKVGEEDFWSEGYENALRIDPEGLKTFADWYRAPLTGNNIGQKDKELLWLALFASPTTAYAPGIQEHMKKALDLGATKEEIISVLELVSVIGVHSLTVSTPILKKQAADMAAGTMWSDRQ